MAKDVNGNEKTYQVWFHTTGPSEARGKLLAADYFTCEPSGAVTFWVRSPDGERSALIAAYGRNEWKSVELAS